MMLQRFYPWLLAAVCCAQAVAADSQPVTLEGASQFEMVSRHTGQHYRIYLSVPEAAPPPGGYPALFVLDGDFSFPVFHVNNPRGREELARLAQREPQSPEPGVVVAIGYGKPFAETMSLRSLDYTPLQPADHAAYPPEKHGGAPRFSRFIEQELKPALAARLPLNPQKLSLFGHSYGGLFTTYHFLNYPTSFRNFFAISPSLWFGERALLEAPLPVLQGKGEPPLLSLWVGEDEQPRTVQAHMMRLQRLQAHRMVDNVQDFATRLGRQSGLVMDVRRVPGQDHGEMHLYGVDRALQIAFTPRWAPSPAP